MGARLRLSIPTSPRNVDTLKHCAFSRDIAGDVRKLPRLSVRRRSLQAGHRLAPARARAGPAPAFDSYTHSAPRYAIARRFHCVQTCAGDVGIEPTLAVLETAVLPLN